MPIFSFPSTCSFGRVPLTEQDREALSKPSGEGHWQHYLVSMVLCSSGLPLGTGGHPGSRTLRAPATHTPWGSFLKNPSPLLPVHSTSLKNTEASFFITDVVLGRAPSSVN